MDQCIICEKEVEYFDIIEVMDEVEVCCNNCIHDLKLDWEELKQDR